MLRFKKPSAYLVYLIFSGSLTAASSILFTVLGVYYVSMVGMNAIQLVLVGTVLEGTIFLLEVPTGVVADTYSRRLSVIIGVFVIGLAFILEGSLAIYAFVLLAEVIRGVGETFLSGATDAWLADEVGEQHVGEVYLRSGQINRIVGLAAILVSVGLATIQLNLPVIVGGGLYLGVGIFLVVAMPEKGFQRAPHHNASSWQAMVATLRSGAQAVRGKQIMMMLVVVSLFSGVASEGFDRLWEAHLLVDFTFPARELFEPVVWFGILNACGSLFSLATTELLRRRMETTSRNPVLAARALLVLNTFSVITVLAFALTRSFPVAFGVIMIRSAIGALLYPLYNAWLIQNIEPRVRATVLSMVNQTNAIGQVAGGPVVGAVGTVYSLRSAITLAGVFLSPGIALYARYIRGTVKSQPHHGLATVFPSVEPGSPELEATEFE